MMQKQQYKQVNDIAHPHPSSLTTLTIKGWILSDRHILFDEHGDKCLVNILLMISEHIMIGEHVRRERLLRMDAPLLSHANAYVEWQWRVIWYNWYLLGNLSCYPGPPHESVYQGEGDPPVMACSLTQSRVRFTWSCGQLIVQSADRGISWSCCSGTGNNQLCGLPKPWSEF